MSLFFNNYSDLLVEQKHNNKNDSHCPQTLLFQCLILLSAWCVSLVFFKPCGKTHVWGLGVQVLDKTTWKHDISSQIYNLGSRNQIICLTVSEVFFFFCQANTTVLSQYLIDYGVIGQV